MYIEGVSEQCRLYKYKDNGWFKWEKISKIVIKKYSNFKLIIFSLVSNPIYYILVIVYCYNATPALEAWRIRMISVAIIVTETLNKFDETLQLNDILK